MHDSLNEKGIAAAGSLLSMGQYSCNEVTKKLRQEVCNTAKWQVTLWLVEDEQTCWPYVLLYVTTQHVVFV